MFSPPWTSSSSPASAPPSPRCSPRSRGGCRRCSQWWWSCWWWWRKPLGSGWTVGHPPLLCIWNNCKNINNIPHFVKTLWDQRKTEYCIKDLLNPGKEENKIFSEKLKLKSNCVLTCNSAHCSPPCWRRERVLRVKYCVYLPIKLGPSSFVPCGRRLENWASNI